MGELFSNYLAGQNQTLSVTGESVDPGSGTIDWLSTAFKTLTINVTLPGQTYEVSTLENPGRRYGLSTFRLSNLSLLAIWKSSLPTKARPTTPSLARSLRLPCMPTPSDSHCRS